MRMRIVVLFGMALLPLICWAQINSDDDSLSSSTLAEVLVTGEYPGPGLWKVTHPENGHVLWLMGEPQLLPLEMKWRSRDIEQVAAQSQLIVLGSGFSIGFDGKVGVLRLLSVAPSILSARKNPNGERLEELVPADIYARWQVQKARVLGRDHSIEKWRPMFAADTLHEEAIKSYLGTKSVTFPSAGLWSVLRRIAKEHGIKFAYPSVNIKIPPKDLRPALKRFSKHSLDDLECFANTVAFVEALADVERINIRATAWATGDLATLRRMPPLPRFQEACDAALVSSEAAAPYNVGNIAERLRTAWMSEVEASVAVNASTLALLPTDELLADDGRLADLRKKGYVVDEP